MKKDDVADEEKEEEYLWSIIQENEPNMPFFKYIWVLEQRKSCDKILLAPNIIENNLNGEFSCEKVMNWIDEPFLKT